MAVYYNHERSYVFDALYMHINFIMITNKQKGPLLKVFRIKSIATDLNITFAIFLVLEIS